jgi:hypothetical protein
MQSLQHGILIQEHLDISQTRNIGCQSIRLDSVIFGVGEDYTIVAKGNVAITFGGRNLLYLDVYFVLGMELNLLLVSQILCHCPKLDIIFSAHKCHLVDKLSTKSIAIDIEDYGFYRLVDTGEVWEHALCKEFMFYQYSLASMFRASQPFLSLSLARENMVEGLLEIQK